MSTMKTAMLAAVAAFSMGIGAVSAQTVGVSEPNGTYFQGQNPASAAPATTTPQAGSSDMSTTHGWPNPTYSNGSILSGVVSGGGDGGAGN
jgi:hypothetical protein